MRLRSIPALGQMQMALSATLLMSVFIEVMYRELSLNDVLAFGLPLLIMTFGNVAVIALIPAGPAFSRERRYRTFIASFLLMVLVGSLPFALAGPFGPVDAFFESMAGFTTTGLSTRSHSMFLEEGRGLLFYRVSIQWVGGLIYLGFAFSIMTEIADISRRSVERRIIALSSSRVRMSNLLRNLTLAYVGMTLLGTAIYRVSGMTLYDSISLSMGAVSTGGYSSMGRWAGGGVGIHLVTAALMFFAGTGFYVHLSLIASRGRRRALLDVENVSYVIIALTAPVLAYLMLMASGSGFTESLWKGSFSAISALTDTGFLVSGMGSWPDSLKLFLILLMLLGGSSLSLTSGLKVHRIILLSKGFIRLVKGTIHPKAELPLKRGEGSYSDKALELANIYFLYLLFILGGLVALVLLFEDGMMDVLSLCSAAVSNTGLAFGRFSGPEGILALSWAVKVPLALAMFLGRLEILLPLYLFSPKSFRFNG